MKLKSTINPHYLSTVNNIAYFSPVISMQPVSLSQLKIYEKNSADNAKNSSCTFCTDQYHYCISCV